MTASDVLKQLQNTDNLRAAASVLTFTKFR